MSILLVYPSSCCIPVTYQWFKHLKCKSLLTNVLIMKRHIYTCEVWYMGSAPEFWGPGISCIMQSLNWIPMIHTQELICRWESLAACWPCLSFRGYGRDLESGGGESGGLLFLAWEEIVGFHLVEVKKVVNKSRGGLSGSLMTWYPGCMGCCYSGSSMLKVQGPLRLNPPQ